MLGEETVGCNEGQCLGDLVCLSDLCVMPDAGSTSASGSDPSTTTTAPDSEGPGDTTADGTTTGNDESSTGCQGATCGEDVCALPPHTPCDDGTDDVFAALGLGCPGGVEVTTTADVAKAAVGVRTGFGGTDTWAPREGSTFAVLGTGHAEELDTETPAGDSDMGPTHCNDNVVGATDPGAVLPPPLQTVDAVGDCLEDPVLVGSGDCSNSVATQFDAAGTAYDYAELRVHATVPASAHSFSYDLAFFSTEYPFYFGSQFNDMYVGWLESELWTGNVSFDDEGNAISLNTSFLDIRDDNGNLPAFDGTCMKQHAGTHWLRSTAPVTPGEQITMVMAVFDLSDSIIDSYVFLDNFQWSCEQTASPVTSALD